MRNLIPAAFAAAAMGAALTASAPAQAQVGLSISIPGIAFSYSSGGYCDRWGCPDEFWDYPVSYCPVYYGGSWYRGPAYYRVYRGRYQYWIRGSWRYDAWGRTRPNWACADRYGPPLGLDFYITNGSACATIGAAAGTATATIGTTTAATGTATTAAVATTGSNGRRRRATAVPCA